MYNSGNTSKNVNGSFIVDGTITNEKIATDAGIDQSKLDTLVITDTNVADNALSGDKIDGGTQSNFAATGIDDNSTSTVITLDSDRIIDIDGVESGYSRGATTLDTTFSVDIPITRVRLSCIVTCGIGGTSGDNQAFRQSFLNGYSLTVTERNIFASESANGGSWSFEKPDNYTLRITHTGGAASTAAEYFIKVESA